MEGEIRDLGSIPELGDGSGPLEENTDWMEVAGGVGNALYSGSLALAVWQTSVLVVRRRRGEMSKGRADNFLMFWCCFGCLYSVFALVDLYASLLSAEAPAKLLRGLLTFALSIRLTSGVNRFTEWAFRTLVSPRLTQAEPDLDKLCSDAGLLWLEVRRALRPLATAALLRVSSDSDPLAFDYSSLSGADDPSELNATKRTSYDDAGGDGQARGGPAQRLAAPVGGDSEPVFVVQGRRKDATVRPVLLARAEMQDEVRSGGGTALEPAPRRFERLHELRRQLEQRKSQTLSR